MMKNTHVLTIDSMKKNISSLQALLAKKGVEALYVSSADPYLNEYVPLENCFRFYVTQFTGSTAEVLFLAEGKPRLYVDGRYYEQADKEVDPQFVDIVKVPFNLGMKGAMSADLAELAIKKLAVVGERTDLELFHFFEKQVPTQVLSEQEVGSCLNLFERAARKPIARIPVGAGDDAVVEKLQRCGIQEDEAYFITALDSIAWLTNCRGYHLPFQSAFYAVALATKDEVIVFIEEGTPLEESAKKAELVTWVEYKNNFKQVLNENLERKKIKKVKIDPGALNISFYQQLREKLGEDKIVRVPGGVSQFHSLKTPLEVQEIERSFALSDQAIINSIRWVREQLRAGRDINELQLYHQTNQFYKEQGAIDQSFNTISGVGTNSSIIHFSSPSAEVKINPGDMILLDSGAYYAGGFATDTTRSFLAGEVTPNPKFIEIYTLVLKGLLQAQNAVFTPGTLGSAIDYAARGPMMKHGHNYNHGTGHGVGINVHEPGARFAPSSTLPIKVGQLVSIEPGIYLEGIGGVRLENIVLVIPHPTLTGFLTFKPVVYIGFDHQLIDFGLLTEEEREYLRSYEQICAQRGTLL